MVRTNSSSLRPDGCMVWLFIAQTIFSTDAIARAVTLSASPSEYVLSAALAVVWGAMGFGWLARWRADRRPAAATSAAPTVRVPDRRSERTARRRATRPAGPPRRDR